MAKDGRRLSGFNDFLRTLETRPRSEPPQIIQTYWPVGYGQMAVYQLKATGNFPGSRGLKANFEGYDPKIGADLVSVFALREDTYKSARLANQALRINGEILIEDNNVLRVIPKKEE